MSRNVELHGTALSGAISLASSRVFFLGACFFFFFVFFFSFLFFSFLFFSFLFFESILWFEGSKHICPRAEYVVFFCCQVALSRDHGGLLADDVSTVDAGAGWVRVRQKGPNFWRTCTASLRKCSFTRSCAHAQFFPSCFFLFSSFIFFVVLSGSSSDFSRCRASWFQRSKAFRWATTTKKNL